MTYTPGKPHDLNLESFDAIIDQYPIVILDFWADWCQPCKMFAEPYAVMAELHPEIFFGKVNVDEAKELAEAFQIRSVPTVMAFKQGELVFEQPGVLPVEHFQKLIAHLQG